MFCLLNIRKIQHVKTFSLLATLSMLMSCGTLTLILWPFGDHEPRLWQWSPIDFPGSSACPLAWVMY